jgi:hypothetical protein
MRYAAYEVGGTWGRLLMKWGTREICCLWSGGHVRYVPYEVGDTGGMLLMKWGTREVCCLWSGGHVRYVAYEERDTWGMLLMKSLLRISTPAYAVYVCCRTYNTKTWLNSADQAVTFLTCIREVPSSNLHRGIKYSASWFCSICTGKLRANS